MNKIDTDIDIDIADRNKLLDLLKYRSARIDRENNEYEKHNTGVYFQDIPYDPFTNISNIDYIKAEEYGFFKIDFLNVHFYKDITSEEHLIQLVNTEPRWELLEHKEVVQQLFHVNQHYELLLRLKPKNIEQLSMILAIIRPGKRYLYDKNWEQIEKEAWIKPKDNTYFFKRSHSIGYSTAIIVQLNLLVEQLNTYE